MPRMRPDPSLILVQSNADHKLSLLVTRIDDLTAANDQEWRKVA